MPFKTLNNVSSYEMVFNQPPSYNYLKIFMCLYYTYLRSYTKSKLELRSLPCVFLGMLSIIKVFSVLNLQVKEYMSLLIWCSRKKISISQTCYILYSVHSGLYSTIFVTIPSHMNTKSTFQMVTHNPTPINTFHNLEPLGTLTYQT